MLQPPLDDELEDEELDEELLEDELELLPDEGLLLPPPPPQPASATIAHDINVICSAFANRVFISDRFPNRVAVTICGSFGPRRVGLNEDTDDFGIGAHSGQPNEY